LTVEVRIRPTKELFFDEESFFGIYGVVVNNDDISKVNLNMYGNISIKGNMTRLEIGKEYIVSVSEDINSKYEGSYILEGMKHIKPITIEQQKDFFKMILTENQVENIFDVYEGKNIIDLIKDDEFEWKKIKGIGEKTFEKMKEKVLDNLDMGELLIFLSQNNLTYGMVAPLVRAYKNPQIVIEKIKMNPYLLTEIKGIGFKKADEIAKRMKYPMDSENRIVSCLKYCIKEENKSGHSWVDRKILLNKAIDLLQINKKYIEEKLDSEQKEILDIDGKFSLKHIYNAEKYIANKFIEYNNSSFKVFESEYIDEFIMEYEKENDIKLSDKQREFFHNWNENKVTFLIGGAGTGKSWLQNILIQLVGKKSFTKSLLAPTGKARKVLAEYTGLPAQTIHSRIGVYGDDSDVKYDITEDLVVVDEASMCDVFIISKLLKAIKNSNTRILFIGDDFQLPSVGVGNFLHDIINSGIVSVTKLDKSFRQSNNGMLKVSDSIKNGRYFLDNNKEGRHVIGTDCVVWVVNDYILDGVLKNYKNALKRFKQEDIVILTPTHKGKLGTININREIQKIVNPPSHNKKEHTFGKENKVTFRVGDLIMNTVNERDVSTVEGKTIDVVNGDSGFISDIDEFNKEFVIDIDGNLIKMKFKKVITNIIHSWSMTIHKSQGSQYPVSIMVADKSATRQLNSNLLYTGSSRAKKYMLIFTQPKTLHISMKKFENMERRSFLKELLLEKNNKY